MESGAVAGAIERCLWVIRAGLYKGDRAAQVRTVDREDMSFPGLVLDGESTECELTRSVVAAAVGHDERRVGAGRCGELDRIPSGDLVDRRVQGHGHL